MSLGVRKVTLIAAALALATIAGKASNAEQVVFSTPGFNMNLVGNSKGSSTPFGFWVWCAAEAAENSQGGYQNDNACQGSMYFYGLDKHATHVIGQVTEGADGIYTMHLVEGTNAERQSGNLHPAYACTLTNTTPDPKGPGNTVQASCAFLDPSLGGGFGAATVTNAVANVTGPS